MTTHEDSDDALRDRLRTFIDDELLPLEQERGVDPEEGIPDDVVSWVIRRSSELGFYGVSLPTEWGGRDLSVTRLAQLKEDLATSGSALWGFVLGERGGVLRIGQMAEVFTEQQKHEYLLPVLAGEKGCCFALTEPGAGSDPRSMQTTAVRDGSDYVITGEKHFISSSVYADFAVVVTKELLEDGETRFTSFLVDRETSDKPGYRLADIQVPMSGERSIGHLVFDECRVPAANLLGEPGKGMALGIDRVSQNRSLWAISYVGWAQNCLDLAVRHATDRVQFGRSISEFQAVQHMLADMETEISAARALTYDVIGEVERGSATRAAASKAKLFASEVAFRAADKAVQIHGGFGLMKGHPVERAFRQLRMYRILSGTSEIQRNVIAKGLLKDS